MITWSWIAGGYGALMALVALGSRGLARPLLSLAASALYMVAALGAARLDALWAQLVVPGALLLTGYWLSGFFRGPPQPGFEDWLLATDRRLFDRLGVNRVLAVSPRWLLDGLEAAYMSDYVLVAAGALVAASAGTRAVERYWTLVLAAELMCYATLPWLRSRPPRVIEPEGPIARSSSMRAFNIALLDRASVRANTFPSGHVAGAVALAFALLPVSGVAASVAFVLASVIAISAVACRYHYAADVALGIVVGGIAGTTL